MCYRLANLLLRFALFYFYGYYTRLRMNRQPSLEQRQHARRVLVGLREHGLGGLGEDVGLGVGGHFLCHVDRR